MNILKMIILVPGKAAQALAQVCLFLSSPAFTSKLPASVLSYCLFIFSVFTCTALQGQTSRELDTLFFDGVYLDDTDEILLSSKERNAGGQAIPLPSAPAPDTDQLSASELFADIRNYEQSISALIETGGAFNPQLAQEYLAISDMYQQAGEYENAVTALENTMHIERVNQGLYTLAQAEAVRKLIANNKAVKNYSEADRYHEYLYYLMSRSLPEDSEEFKTAILEWANWNMEAFKKTAFSENDAITISTSVSNIGATMLRNGDLIAIQDDQFSEIVFIPRSALNNNPADIRLQSFTADQLVDARLKRAQDLYEQILETEPDNEEILQKQADITHLYKTQIEQYINKYMVGSSIRSNSDQLFRSVSFFRRGYADNRDELETKASALELTNPQEAAMAYIDLADWDLDFGNNQKARLGYTKAWEILVANGFSEEQASSFITPEPALFIPTFVSHVDTRSFQDIPENMDIPYLGYLDVSFNKRRDGSLRRVRIENASENVSQLVRNRLIDMLQTTKVRPTISAGEFEEQENIKMRYYFAY